MRLSTQEKNILKKGYLIAGIDEAGRGPWAGPVVAAAIVLKSPAKINFNDFKFLNDSKKMTARQRESLFEKTKSHPQIEWTVSLIQPQTIDRINIGRATELAWQKSLARLKTRPNFVFIDGQRKIPKTRIEQKAVIRGDGKLFVLALASVMAKVFRDKLMLKLDKKYPDYSFDQHKGYGTQAHLANLKKHGVCSIHRKSFRPVFEALSFSDKVYFKVSQIPKGQTLSYKEVAEAIGHQGAYRAVGGLLKKNYQKNIPCHRVIKSNGQVGQYNRGLIQKRRLLKAEGFLKIC